MSARIPGLRRIEQHREGEQRRQQKHERGETVCDQHDSKRRRPIADLADERRTGFRLRQDGNRCREKTQRGRRTERAHQNHRCALQDEEQCGGERGEDDLQREQVIHGLPAGLETASGSTPST